MCTSVMPLIADGQYRIFNGKFPTQDVDLLLGTPMATIGGYVNNSNTFNMVWNLTNVGNQVDQVTLLNAAPSAVGAYASINSTADVEAGVYGGPGAAVWKIIPTPQSGQYWIIAPSDVNSSIPSGLVMSLASGVNFTPIKLAPITVNDSSQVWTFSPEAGTGKGGNVTTIGLNGLD